MELRLFPYALFNFNLGFLVSKKKPSKEKIKAIQLNTGYKIISYICKLHLITIPVDFYKYNISSYRSYLVCMK